MNKTYADVELNIIEDIDVRKTIRKLINDKLKKISIDIFYCNIRSTKMFLLVPTAQDIKLNTNINKRDNNLKLIYIYQPSSLGIVNILSQYHIKPDFETKHNISTLQFNANDPIRQRKN